MLSVIHSQYHVYWCTGDLRSQCIRRHPMRKKLATVTAHRELTVSSLWAHGDQNCHNQPWLSRDLGHDWAVTEPWSYWRCRDWAVTLPWLSCDLAVTELWPRRDWAVTSPSRDWAVIIGPGAVTTVVTVSSLWAHRELNVTIFFSWDGIDPQSQNIPSPASEELSTKPFHESMLIYRIWWLYRSTIVEWYKQLVLPINH